MAKLYMVPTIISDGQIGSLAPDTLKVIRILKHYVSERARTTRRFLKLCELDFPISDIEIVEMDKKELLEGSQSVLSWLKEGNDVGVMSESGIPGVADPGQVFASLAHKHGFQVVPLTGPSSIILALSASGLNGQDFVFHGYLPIKEPALKNKLVELNRKLGQGQTQIFIETPYRNQRMMTSLLKHLSPEVKICLAYDITGSEEYIKTKSVKQWKQSIPSLEKMPCVFLIGL